MPGLLARVGFWWASCCIVLSLFSQDAGAANSTCQPKVYPVTGDLPVAVRACLRGDLVEGCFDP